MQRQLWFLSKGGSWCSWDFYTTANRCSTNTRGYKSPNMGFRVVSSALKCWRVVQGFSWEVTGNRVVRPVFRLKGDPFVRSNGLGFCVTALPVKAICGGSWRDCHDVRAALPRAVRSGSWGTEQKYARTGFRFRLNPSYRRYSLGFRIVREDS